MPPYRRSQTGQENQEPLAHVPAALERAQVVAAEEEEAVVRAVPTAATPPRVPTKRKAPAPAPSAPKVPKDRRLELWEELHIAEEFSEVLDERLSVAVDQVDYLGKQVREQGATIAHLREELHLQRSVMEAVDAVAAGDLDTINSLRDRCFVERRGRQLAEQRAVAAEKCTAEAVQRLSLLQTACAAFTRAMQGGAME